MFFLFSFLFACQDYTVAGIEKRQADIMVYPQHINFGHLLSGLETETETQLGNRDTERHGEHH